MDQLEFLYVFFYLILITWKPYFQAEDPGTLKRETPGFMRQSTHRMSQGNQHLLRPVPPPPTPEYPLPQPPEGSKPVTVKKHELAVPSTERKQMWTPAKDRETAGKHGRRSHTGRDSGPPTEGGSFSRGGTGSQQA